jgi:hypothetical protein
MEMVGETETIDWYERRSELECEQVFSTYDGSIVKLDRQVPGDGTRWYVADWYMGYPATDRYPESKPHWSYEDSTIEPGDLRERVTDPAALTRATTP